MDLERTAGERTPTLAAPAPAKETGIHRLPETTRTSAASAEPPRVPDWLHRIITDRGGRGRRSRNLQGTQGSRGDSGRGREQDDGRARSSAVEARSCDLTGSTGGCSEGPGRATGSLDDVKHDARAAAPWCGADDPASASPSTTTSPSSHSTSASSSGPPLSFSPSRYSSHYSPQGNFSRASSTASTSSSAASSGFSSAASASSVTSASSKATFSALSHEREKEKVREMGQEKMLERHGSAGLGRDKGKGRPLSVSAADSCHATGMELACFPSPSSEHRPLSLYRASTGSAVLLPGDMIPIDAPSSPNLLAETDTEQAVTQYAEGRAGEAAGEAFVLAPPALPPPPPPSQFPPPSSSTLSVGLARLDSDSSTLTIPSPASASAIPALTLNPPENFAMVSPHLYRSSFPRNDHFEFLRSLGLRSVMTLVQEEYPEENLEFLRAEGIQFFQFGIPGNKEPFVSIPEDKIVAAMAILLDTRNHPLLIHCNKGKHRTGCLVGCLRRLQTWSLTAIFDEYRRYSHPKSRSMDLQFIEAFEGLDKVWELATTNRQNLPSWACTVPYSTPVRGQAPPKAMTKERSRSRAASVGSSRAAVTAAAGAGAAGELMEGEEGEER
ncbi:hypothetical protein JCM21900_001791 [Sporobolomyces salmonicolor]